MPSYYRSLEWLHTLFLGHFIVILLKRASKPYSNHSQSRPAWTSHCSEVEALNIAGSLRLG